MMRPDHGHPRRDCCIDRTECCDRLRPHPADSADCATGSCSLGVPPGGEIIAWGGASFAQSLSRAGLIDEYVLVIHPVAFGSGLPMFRDLPKALRLELIEAQIFDTGTVLHVYEPSERAGRPRG
jgi:dihydrofolate reductase